MMYRTIGRELKLHSWQTSLRCAVGAGPWRRLMIIEDLRPGNFYYTIEVLLLHEGI